MRIQSILSPSDSRKTPDSDTAAATWSFAWGPTKESFHDAVAATASDAPIDPSEPPAPPQAHPPPPERLPNIRQALPRSPPRPAAVGAVRTQAHTGAIGAVADDAHRWPVQTPMMAGSPGSPGAVDTKKGIKRTPKRSSIACQRCHKSKIKCNNTGGDKPCEACIRSGKECIYPVVTSARPKRSEPSAGVKMEQGTEQKRQRVTEDIVRMEGAVPAAAVTENILSAPYLTEAVWSQLFDIYRLHFATELPFLHMATLKEKLGSRFRAKPSDTSPEINLLLGILTLTARFHSTLVSYITALRKSPAVSGVAKPRSTGPVSDASSASEYYANALTNALGGLRTSMTVASVERVQAFLMLGLYEWSQARPRGMAAWMCVGVAIRMAQAFGLGDGNREPSKVFRPRLIKPPQQTIPASQRIIAKEIRRRTMFSCLILDRLLGCGKDRVSTIRSEDLQIQLPCSEVSFDLSEEVYTGFLKPIPGVDPDGRTHDSVLGRFVRLVDLWGEISKEISSVVTRDNFFQLRRKLYSFYGDLPDFLRWSESNYYKHENHQAGSGYVSLHMLGAVCRIMLHREYIPFIPILCDKPVGPLDEPTFPQGDKPQGFWEASAEEIFHAAKEIVDLTEICRDKLPMSSLVLFAVWAAAFVGIYAVHFPYMDTKGHMLPKQKLSGELDLSKHGPTGLTYRMLKTMSAWLKLAETYVDYFRQVASYYDMVKQDYERHIGRRKGGGGLKEWKQQGFKVVNNGKILDIDEEKGYSRYSTAEPGSPVRPDSNLPAVHAKTPRSTSISFTPINTLQPHQDQSNSTSSEAAAEAAALTLWCIRQQSPSQSSSGAIPSPQMQQNSQPTVMGFSKLSLYDAGGVVSYVEQNQSLPWNQTPITVEYLAYGTENTGNMY